MAFCTDCGHELIQGDKFCGQCGKLVEGDNAEEGRKQFYDGELHKCPGCGEVLGAFATKCSCGYELRGIKTSNVAADLETKLQAIEFKRGIIDDKSIKERKIGIIENCFIPNTKEDIFEFMILAASHIDMRDKRAKRDKLMLAWKKKFEQAYYKAKISFGDSEDFQKVHRIYKDEIIKPRIIKILKIAGIIAIDALFILFCVIGSQA